MQTGVPNPLNRRRPELTRAEPPVLIPEPPTSQGPAFRLDIKRSLQMHPVLAGVVTAVVFVTLVAWALGRKPVYTAESLIYVEPLEVRVLNDGSAGGYDPSRYDSYLQQQVQTVERADTLEAALNKLPAGVWRFPGESTASAVKRLGGTLKVERVLNSYQLAIDVTAGDPESAAAAANAVTTAYLEKGRSDEHARADQRLQLLLEERQRIIDERAKENAEQASLGRSLGVANPSGATGNPYDLQSENLRSQLASAREARDAVEAQLASVSGANGTGLGIAANEIILADPGLVSIRQTLSQRRAVLSDQMAGLMPSNPVYKQDQEELAVIDRAIERATVDARQRAERQLQDKLRLDLRRTADVESRLNAQLAEQTAKATGAGPRLQRAAELETDVQRLTTRFAAVDDAIRGLQLETGGPGQSHLALAARAPDAAQPNRSRLVFFLALPLAMFCGIGAAVIARKRDNKVYLASDVQEVLGFAPMCVLPNPSEVSPAAYDEFLLRLAGGLESALEHGSAHVFVFTAVSIERSSANWVPKLCSKLRHLGFRAVCINAEELMSGAAHSPDSSRNALRRVRAQDGVGLKRLQDLLGEHDFVLIQAPPLLGSAVTEYVVRCADATILLAESTRTARKDLRKAAQLLERLNPQGVGSVLENMPMRYADQIFRAAVRTAKYSPVVSSEGDEEQAGSQPGLHGLAKPAAIAEDLASSYVSPEEPKMTQIPEIHVQENSTEALEREEERPEEFVSIPISFQSIAFNDAESTHQLPPLDARLEGDEQSEQGAWRGMRELETPAFETEKFRPLSESDRLSSAIETVENEATASKTAPEEQIPVEEASSTEVAGIAEPLVTSPSELHAIYEFTSDEQRAGAFANEEATEKESLEEDTDADSEDRRPSSWYHRLLHFSEGASQQTAAEHADAAVRSEAASIEFSTSTSTSEDSHHASRQRGDERPIEVVFAEAAAPTLIFEKPSRPSGSDAAKDEHIVPAFEHGTDISNSAEEPPDEEVSPASTGESAAFVEDNKEQQLGEVQDETGSMSVADPVVPHTPDTEAPGAAEAEQIPAEVEVEAPAVSEPEVGPSAVPEVRDVHSIPVDRDDDATHEYPAGGPETDAVPEPATEPPASNSYGPRIVPPITMEAIPSLITSLSMGKHRQEPGEILPPAKPPLSERPPAAQVPILNVAEGSARYRPGLARAVRHASFDDGPPARASEGLTAMRHGSRQPEEAVRQENGNGSTQYAPAPQTSGSGMTRRWGMLSRFQREPSTSESGDEELAAMGAKTGPTETGD